MVEVKTMRCDTVTGCVAADTSVLTDLHQRFFGVCIFQPLFQPDRNSKGSGRKSAVEKREEQWYFYAFFPVCALFAQVKQDRGENNEQRKSHHIHDNRNAAAPGL